MQTRNGTPTPTPRDPHQNQYAPLPLGCGGGGIKKGRLDSRKTITVKEKTKGKVTDSEEKEEIKTGYFPAPAASIADPHPSLPQQRKARPTFTYKH